MNIPNQISFGGAYQVTFRPDGADCFATHTFAAPKSPDVYSWIFHFDRLSASPTGCFTYCRDIKDYPYIIGPIPEFEGGYQYDFDGNAYAVGIGVVQDLQIGEGLQGALNLTLNNSYCNITTDYLDITALACEECDGLVNITDVEEVNNPIGFASYNIIGGGIQNPTNLPVTFTLSSIHGSFIPALVSIPPGGTYNFANNPVLFIPFNPVQGSILLEYVITVNYGVDSKTLCLGAMNVNMIDLSGFTGGSIVMMRVVPNPVASQTHVHYVVEDQPEFKGGTLKLYSLNGRLIESKKVHESQGQASFNMSGLASGTYVVVFFSQGQRLSQQIIIKE